MAEARAPVSEPRYWKFTINPEECPRGAWEASRSAGLAMLGLPGEEGETHYAVKNLKRIRVGDWLVAYTPQEGSYTVGGVGRVVRGYECEEAPFDHPWSGPLRRSVGVEWEAGSCRIDDLVKEGRFRKGKISRLLDEILPEEFEVVCERVRGAASPARAALPEWESALRDTLVWMAERERQSFEVPASLPSLVRTEEPEPVLVPAVECSVTEPELEPNLSAVMPFPDEPTFELSSEEAPTELAARLRDEEGLPEFSLEAPAEGAEEEPSGRVGELPEEIVWEVSEERVVDLTVLEEVFQPGTETGLEEAGEAEEELQVMVEAEPLRPSPVVFDPAAEPPPLPEFFLEMAENEPAPIFKMDEPVGPRRPAPAASAARPASATPRGNRAASTSQAPKSLAESAAALRRSHEAQLLASFGLEPRQEVLEFGLPTVGEDELPLDEFEYEDGPVDLEGVEPFEVRVGTLGWTGIFRREMESGRPCSLLLRGPQYSFLNMAQPGIALRGLPLFALFAIGAVSAPGKEALRSGATFIFQGRRASGDYAVEVRPRQRRPIARQPVEASH